MDRLACLGMAAAGGVIAWRCVPQRSRDRLSAAVGDWMAKGMTRHMGRMMSGLPDNAPPKLIVSILPKLQVQNEQIIKMLREQNELLRKQHSALAIEP